MNSEKKSSRKRKKGRKPIKKGHKALNNLPESKRIILMIWV